MLDIPVQAGSFLILPGKSGRGKREVTTIRLSGGEAGHASSQEKPLSFSCAETVPQTDTGGWEEYSKALERTRVKELGKMTP